MANTEATKYAYTYTYTYTYIVRIYIDVKVCILYICMDEYICIYKSVSIVIYRHIHKQRHTCIINHTHMHTHII
jgi:hypothetical protein